MTIIHDPSYDRSIASQQLRALLASGGFAHSFRFSSPSRELGGCVERLDSFLEEIDHGGPLNTIDAEKLVAYSRALAEQVPGFIDAHAHLCIGLNVLGQFELAALLGYQKLMEIESCLPHGGQVAIDYLVMENRPYFRLLEATFDSLLKVDTPEGLLGATFVAGLCLARSPSDHLGLRERIGQEVCLRRAGDGSLLHIPGEWSWPLTLNLNAAPRS
ncbi:hypothetical protein [Cupriavidus sp. TMH.W2]|uniref:hypothetical protein n=1 Tax=Cupriavidus sp. TMH.W2 TaxID=3434465 RepID=UPI003D76E267